MIAPASRSRIAALAALLLVPPAVIAQAPPKPPASAARGPLVADTATGQRIRVTQVAGGLVHPYSLAFPDSRTILVAERSGRLRIIRDGVLLERPSWEAPPAPPGSPPGNNPPDALHFIELHPGFAQNRLVYLAYPKYGPRGNTIAVGRGKLTGDALVDFQEIFVSEAWESYGANPGRMLFGRDGTLYVTIGDRDRYCWDLHEARPEQMPSFAYRYQLAQGNRLPSTIRRLHFLLKPAGGWARLQEPVCPTQSWMLMGLWTCRITGQTQAADWAASSPAVREVGSHQC